MNLKVKRRELPKMEEYDEVEKGYSDKFDVFKLVSDVQSRIKTDIRPDFVLAKLEIKDKEACIEMVNNSYFAKKLVMMLIARSYKWIRDPKTGFFKKGNLIRDDLLEMQELAESIFDSLMVRIYMTVNLNRNVDKNYLVGVLSGYEQEREELAKAEEPKMTKKDVLKSLLGNHEKEK